MLAKRVIPCLDVSAGRTVKGTKFVGLKDVGDPVELAQRYNQQSADELVFLDISATNEQRETVVDLVEKLAKHLFIPFTIGGGISSLQQMQELTSRGADKIAINTAALQNPSLITAGAEKFGSQCIVVSIDAKKHGSSWRVYSHAGQRDSQKDALEWALEAQKRGAGEILLTSIDQDGTKQGFDIDLTRTISTKLNIPVIASGGGGELKHFAEVLQSGAADAVLAASIFHNAEYTIQEVKLYLKQQGLVVRL